MIPCKAKKCAYKMPIAGNCHISCAYDWQNAPEGVQEQVPQCQADHGRQWFNFPYNYDPVWADVCPAFSKEADPEMIYEFSAVECMMALMG